MRFLHLADLHIGKVLHKHNLIDDQKYILQQILEIAKTHDIDAVLIAGDVYQRSSPAPEAMTVFADFVTALADMQLPVFIIAGNHDSAERVAYLSALAERSGVHIASADAGIISAYQLQDDYGSLTVHMMNFTSPIQARLHFKGFEDEIQTYEDAVRMVLSTHPMTLSGRHVLIAHQYLTGAEISESDELAIGGQDNISAALFNAFDYAALGHLHGAQWVSRPEVRYAGSPLPYSFSEAVRQKKSVTIADVREKGHVEIETVPLKPLHNMRELTGTFAEMIAQEPSDDYVHVTLTDETPPADAVRQLRSVFRNLMLMTVHNSHMREDRTVEAEAMPAQSDFLTMLTDFYRFQNNQAEMSESQMKIVRKLMEQLDGKAGV